MFASAILSDITSRRRLHGRRGLKWSRQLFRPARRRSPPSRAAWIEIPSETARKSGLESPPSRAAWIEIVAGAEPQRLTASPPSRAAWIEIACSPPEPALQRVAAFTGGVD